MHILGHAERRKRHVRQTGDKVSHNAVPLVPCNKQTKPEYKSDYMRPSVCVRASHLVGGKVHHTKGCWDRSTLTQTHTYWTRLYTNVIDFPLYHPHTHGWCGQCMCACTRVRHSDGIWTVMLWDNTFNTLYLYYRTHTIKACEILIFNDSEH